MNPLGQERPADFPSSSKEESFSKKVTKAFNQRRVQKLSTKVKADKAHIKSGHAVDDLTKEHLQELEGLTLQERKQSAPLVKSLVKMRAAQTTRQNTTASSKLPGKGFIQKEQLKLQAKQKIGRIDTTNQRRELDSLKRGVNQAQTLKEEGDQLLQDLLQGNKNPEDLKETLKTLNDSLKSLEDGLGESSLYPKEMTTLKNFLSEVKLGLEFSNYLVDHGLVGGMELAKAAKEVSQQEVDSAGIEKLTQAKQGVNQLRAQAKISVDKHEDYADQVGDILNFELKLASDRIDKKGERVLKLNDQEQEVLGVLKEKDHKNISKYFGDPKEGASRKQALTLAVEKEIARLDYFTQNPKIQNQERTALGNSLAKLQANQTIASEFQDVLEKKTVAAFIDPKQWGSAGNLGMYKQPLNALYGRLKEADSQKPLTAEAMAVTTSKIARYQALNHLDPKVKTTGVFQEEKKPALLTQPREKNLMGTWKKKGQKNANKQLNYLATQISLANVGKISKEEALTNMAPYLGAQNQDPLGLAIDQHQEFKEVLVDFIDEALDEKTQSLQGQYDAKLVEKLRGNLTHFGHSPIYTPEKQATFLAQTQSLPSSQEDIKKAFISLAKEVRTGNESVAGLLPFLDKSGAILQKECQAARLYLNFAAQEILANPPLDQKLLVELKHIQQAKAQLTDKPSTPEVPEALQVKNLRFDTPLREVFLQDPSFFKEQFPKGLDFEATLEPLPQLPKNNPLEEKEKNVLQTYQEILTTEHSSLQNYILTRDALIEHKEAILNDPKLNITQEDLDLWIENLDGLISISSAILQDLQEGLGTCTDQKSYKEKLEANICRAFTEDRVTAFVLLTKKHQQTVGASLECAPELGVTINQEAQKKPSEKSTKLQQNFGFDGTIKTPFQRLGKLSLFEKSILKDRVEPSETLVHTLQVMGSAASLY